MSSIIQFICDIWIYNPVGTICILLLIVLLVLQIILIRSVKKC
jgi:hypothetical protein